MYDPILAMFLSPDPFIQSPHETQNYNRYAYVMNNPLKYIDPSGYTKKKKDDPCKRKEPPEWIQELIESWHWFWWNLGRLGNSEGDNKNPAPIISNHISPWSLDGPYGVNAYLISTDGRQSTMGDGGNNDNSTDIHLGYSGDIALVVGPIGGNYEMGELSKIGFFTTKGYSVGLEASFGFNILVLVPKSSFRVSNYFGETAEFDINLSGISLALTGDKSQYLINNQWFNSYFLFKFGIGLGAGGSYTPHSFTKKGNSFLEYFTTRQPNRIYWNPTWR